MSKFSFGPSITSALTGNTSSSFGIQQKQTSGFSIATAPFGSTTPASGTLTFGTTTPATTTCLSLSFGVSTPAIITHTPNLNLGTGTSTASLNAFPNLTAATTQASGLTFGTPATSGNLTFGTPSTTGALTFGTPATSGVLSFRVPATSTTFGATSAAPTAASLFGSTSVNNLLAGKSTAVINTSTGTTANKGLGGLDVSISNKGLSQGGSSPTAAKENLLPNELMQTIDNFKEFVKTQKVLSSDIARGSSRPLNRCAEDTASLMEVLTTLAGSVQRDRSLADKLKQDTAKALQNAEIAQRTHDTPPGLQYENNAPLLFFMELAENFEQDLMLFKSQIETTEKHIETMMTPKTLTPQELTMAMGKLHESLVAVAGRLQGVHSKVQQQKEQYLNFRKYVLKDSTNVFEDIKSERKTNKNNAARITSGPTPFAPGNKSFLTSTGLNSSQPPSYGTPNPLVWGNITPTPSVTSFSMGTTMKPPTSGLNFNTPINLTAPLSASESNSSFQLQKPPLGNKRGKF
ncbi:nucleoporin p58/p45 isoform X2 [Belonocnema kinseyi]|uniref:nucleoporin p58/p45 isoform X2 n=1 Tax=Belonocnema kinseyi TaxID=2817044 RepID=UPI00143D4BBB|nr:nucleoporin p58/p45 isoform X2 [Belonocnema kinseyi]